MMNSKERDHSQSLSPLCSFNAHIKPLYIKSFFKIYENY